MTQIMKLRNIHSEPLNCKVIHVNGFVTVHVEVFSISGDETDLSSAVLSMMTFKPVPSVSECLVSVDRC